MFSSETMKPLLTIRLLSNITFSIEICYKTIDKYKDIKITKHFDMHLRNSTFLSFLSLFLFFFL